MAWIIFLWQHTELPLLTFFFAGLVIFVFALWTEEKLEILGRWLKQAIKKEPIHEIGPKKNNFQF